MAIFGKKRRGSSAGDERTPLRPRNNEELASFLKAIHGSNTSPTGLPSQQQQRRRSLSINHRLSERQMKRIAARMQRVPSSLFDGQFEGNGDSPADSTSLVMESLRRENDTLTSRCRKLEAQNVICAAQQVDFIAVVLGFTTCAMFYCGFALCVCRLVDYDDYSCLLARVAIIAAPYIYNKLKWGVVYRRFMVFAVFVVFLARVRLCRWRVQKYIKSSQNQDLSSLRGEESGSMSTGHFGDDISEDDIMEASYEVNARFLYSSILRLRGLWTKTAQYMASRADFVPVGYVRELGKLQDEAPETEWDDVRKMLSKAGILNDFVSIESKPIASASIGQVHIAKLQDSHERVVIKVQHPHASTLLSDDFVSLNIMAAIVGWLEPEYKFIGILLKEWANEARNELDFNSEVANLKTAHESIELMKTTTDMMTTHSDKKRVTFDVEVPRPVDDLCKSKRVMVMTFSEGKRIDDLDQIKKCGVPKEAIMNGLAHATAHMMFVADIFNGDPHPGNIFIRPGTSRSKDGFTLVLLDWGLAKRLPKCKRQGFCEMTYAASTFDFGLMMDAFSTLGLKLKRENVSEDMDGVRFLLRDMAPRGVARKRLKARMKTNIDRTKARKKGEKVPVDSNAYPGEFFFFVRTNELMQGLGSKLGVELRYIEILKPYALKGLKMLTSQTAHRDPDDIPPASIADHELNRKIGLCLNRLKSDGVISGAQVCVVQHENILAHCTEGHLGSLKNDVAVRPDSLFLGFSCTKAVATTLILKMVELKYLSLDEPISKRIWPQFAPCIHPPPALLDALDEDATTITKKWQWKRSITLRHILTHTSGLWFATPSNLTIESLASLESCAMAFNYDPSNPVHTILPVSKPGSTCAYHYISFGWLVGGCVIRSYREKHAQEKTYEEIFDEVCGSLIPSAVEAGFKPCGAKSTDNLALVDAEFDLTGQMQMRKELAAMGELVESEDSNASEDDSGSMIKVLLQGIKGREWLLDPRIWNSQKAIRANVPAAGGRFSAKGLALFYHELGNGRIISDDFLAKATAAQVTEESLQMLQGQMPIASSSGGSDAKTQFGLGYAVIDIKHANDCAAFGHAGVGGSIGLHHKKSKTSIAIMFNKVGNDKESAKEIINIVSEHLSW